MAIGSLEPDSASSVEFNFWRIFCVPSTENTAAASVEQTIAPNKKPSSQVTPKIIKSTSEGTPRRVENFAVSTPMTRRIDNKRIEWSTVKSKKYTSFVQKFYVSNK